MSKIQINNEVRDMTSEEENQHNADLQQAIKDKEKIIAKENNKTSGKQKLKDLGLTEEEVKALMGA